MFRTEGQIVEDVISRQEVDMVTMNSRRRKVAGDLTSRVLLGVLERVAGMT